MDNNIYLSNFIQSPYSTLLGRYYHYENKLSIDKQANSYSNHDIFKETIHTNDSFKTFISAISQKQNQHEEENKTKQSTISFMQTLLNKICPTSYLAQRQHT